MERHTFESQTSKNQGLNDIIPNFHMMHSDTELRNFALPFRVPGEKTLRRHFYRVMDWFLLFSVRALK